jgi:parallel beta helix pectate lyase-like protein
LVRQITLRSALIAVALAVLVTQVSTILYLNLVIFPDLWNKNLPTDATYVIEPYGTNFLALRSDGLTQFKGTDAYTVIQSAINATDAETGGKVLLRGGTYVLHHSLLLYEHITLQGESIASTSLVQGFDGDAIDMVRRPGDNQTIGFQQIRDLTITGVRKGYTVGDGISNKVFSDTIIEHVFIDNFPGNGIYEGAGQYHRIVNNWIESNAANGISLYAAWAFVANNAFYHDNDGIYVGALAYGAKIIGNTFYDCANIGLSLSQGSTSAVVTGNIFYNSSYYDIYDNGGQYVSILGNGFAFSSKEQYRLYLSGAMAGVLITGNTFRNPGSLGTIFVSPSSPSRSGLIIRSNSGFNPVNWIKIPFDTTHRYIGLGGTSSLMSNETNYVISGVDCQFTVYSGTGVAIMVRDGAGNVIVTGTTLEGYFISVGEAIEINWTSPPVIAVYGS